jgi:tetratricopeptide (TPR) repeat protein
MGEIDTPDWIDAADAHATGDGPPPGTPPDTLSRAEAQLFSALPALAAPQSLDGDPSAIEGLLDQFAAGGAPTTAAATSSFAKWGGLAALGGLAVALALLLRPEALPPAALQAPTPTVAPTGESDSTPSALATSPQSEEARPELSPEEEATPALATPEPAQSSSASPAKKQSRNEPALSAAALLAKARMKRGQGEKRAAERLYRKLHHDWPSSPESHVSRISLGQLQLSLGKAKSALRAFEAYKRKGGPLLEEAHWGIVKANERLGRYEARDRAIEELVTRFPSSAYRSQAAKLGGQP